MPWEQPYSIEWLGPARRGLKRVRRDMHKPIMDAVEALAANPRPEGVEKMQGEYAEYWKIRVTIHFRVMYLIDDDARHIKVGFVTSREGVPY